MKENDREVASAVRSVLADKVGADRFDLWFGSDVTFQFEHGRLQVSVSDEFLLERLRRGFRHDIVEACRMVAGGEMEIEFRIAKIEPTTLPLSSAPRAPGPRTVSSHRHCERRPEPCGDRIAGEELSFVTGPEHRIAQSSSDMILGQPGKVTPLYIYGPTGCGKTHFLQTISRKARHQNQMRRVVYVSAEQFTTHFVESLQGSGLPNFRRKYRDLELLIIDDLQFFAGKKTTLVELQNTIDSLLRDRRQLVLAADRSPAELGGFNQVLLGRLAGGLVCTLPYPELSTRRRILEQLAEKHGGFSADVLDLVAVQLNGDVRQLNGAIHRLVAVRHALGRELDLPTARSTLDDLFRVTRRSVRLADIEQAVCEVFGIEKQSLQSGGRRRHISQPRMLAMWLARKHTRAGLAEICRFFGRRSHSTVVSAEQQVTRWLNTGTPVRLAHGDVPIEDAIRRLEGQIRAG